MMNMTITDDPKSRVHGIPILHCILTARDNNAIAVATWRVELFYHSSNSSSIFTHVHLLPVYIMSMHTYMDVHSMCMCDISSS